MCVQDAFNISSVCGGCGCVVRFQRTLQKNISVLIGYGVCVQNMRIKPNAHKTISGVVHQMSRLNRCIFILSMDRLHSFINRFRPYSTLECSFLVQPIGFVQIFRFICFAFAGRGGFCLFFQFRGFLSEFLKFSRRKYSFLLVFFQYVSIANLGFTTSRNKII